MNRQLILIIIFLMTLNIVVMMLLVRRNCPLRLLPLESAVDRANTSSSSYGSKKVKVRCVMKAVRDVWQK